MTKRTEKERRMIAAAPEMYEALRDLLTWAATHRDADYQGQGDTFRAVPEWTAAKAALAKAEGRQ